MNPGRRPRRHPWDRPFVVAAGRTRAAVHLEMHTRLLPAGIRPVQDAGPEPDAQALFGLLCTRGLAAVTELSASCAMPLGLALVLLGDLVERGLVTVAEEPDRHDPRLLERIRVGLLEL